VYGGVLVPDLTIFIIPMAARTFKNTQKSNLIDSDFAKLLRTYAINDS